MKPKVIVHNHYGKPTRDAYNSYSDQELEDMIERYGKAGINKEHRIKMREELDKRRRAKDAVAQTEAAARVK